MRVILIIIGLAFGTCTFGQNKITGRWKPVFVSIDKIITADIKKDTVFLSDTIDVALKSSKDPEGTKKMIQAIIGMMAYKMQSMEQEFTAPDIYTEINKQTKTNNSGTYSFNETSNALTTVLGSTTVTYTVSFKNDHLVLASELGSGPDSKRKFIVEYEKR